MLFVAWFLNFFGFGNMFITGLEQWTGIQITMTGFYFIFAVVGLIKNIIEKFHYGKDLELLAEKITNKLK